MDIFNSEKVKSKAPVIYPNLALRGNRAVKYSLSKSSSIQSKERELTIPSLPFIDKYEERKITNLVMLANKHYRLSKHRIREGSEFVLDLAKIYACQFNAAQMYSKLKFPSEFDNSIWNTNPSNGWRSRLGEQQREFVDTFVERVDELQQQYPDEIGNYLNTRIMAQIKLDDDTDVLEKLLRDNLTPEQFNYALYTEMQIQPLPEINNQEILNTYEKAIDIFYQSRKFAYSYFYVLEHIGIAAATYVFDEDFQRMVTNAVQRKAMFGFDADIIEAEVDFFYDMCNDIRTIIKNGQQMYNAHKYPHYRTKYHYRTGIMTKSSITIHKGMVRSIYNHLMLKGATYVQHNYAQRGKALPTEIAMQMQEAVDGGINLPDGLSNELKEQIKAEGNRDARFRFKPEYHDATGRHGKAYIRPFTPNAKVPKAIRELQKRNSDIGVVPKNMHRMTLDRKVFSSKKVIAGGSLMIDCSGSMYWSEEDLREVIELLPAAKIAGYEGYNRKEDGYDGLIRIFAENGKLDTKQISDAGEYGCNSVDLDALKWLAKQPEPRIWVSDQAVVGVNDEGRAVSLNPKLKNEILQFMIKNNIIPIKSNKLVKQVAKELSTSVKKSR